MQERPCARDDLLCEVPQWNKWTIDNDGWPEGFWSEGDRGPDGDIDGYLCGNCGRDFIVDRSADCSRAMELAWQEALGHLSETKGAR